MEGPTGPLGFGPFGHPGSHWLTRRRWWNEEPVRARKFNPWFSTTRGAVLMILDVTKTMFLNFLTVSVEWSCGWRQTVSRLAECHGAQSKFFKSSVYIHLSLTFNETMFLRNCLHVWTSFSKLPRQILMKISAIESPLLLLFKKYRFLGRNIKLEASLGRVLFIFSCLRWT